MKYYTLLFITILAAIFASSIVSAAPCTQSDCPLWAKQGHYATPVYTSSVSYGVPTTSYIKTPAPRVTHYEFINVQHPPKHMFVHFNQNYYDHYGDGRYQTSRQRGFVHNINRQQHTSYRTHTSRHSSPTILRGQGFNRYY